jgi:hypothetical protein
VPGGRACPATLGSGWSAARQRGGPRSPAGAAGVRGWWPGLPGHHAGLNGAPRPGRGPGGKGCGVSPSQGMSAQRPLSLPVNLLFRAGLWRVPAEPGGVAGGGLRDGSQRVLPSWPPSARCRRGLDGCGAVPGPGPGAASRSWLLPGYRPGGRRRRWLGSVAGRGGRAGPPGVHHRAYPLLGVGAGVDVEP